jgi:hypothetical protein
MTITEARAWLRNFATDADSSRYDTTILDQAIQFAGNEFCRRTRAIRKVSDVSLTAADSTPDISGAVATFFRPERLIDAFIPGQITPLSVVDYFEQNVYASEDTTSGTPQTLAFIDLNLPDDYLLEILTYGAPATSSTTRRRTPTPQSWQKYMAFEQRRGAGTLGSSEVRQLKARGTWGRGWSTGSG